MFITTIIPQSIISYLNNQYLTISKLGQMSGIWQAGCISE